ncbi:MAG: flagellar biosynthetic protein FliO [candidate division Zixibacteria bacterium]|nr:flagellar biosynthetic protein FliO [candidate division Zixibacteria bacterium]
MKFKLVTWMICLAFVLLGAWEASADTDTGQSQAVESGIFEELDSVGVAAPLVPSVTEDILPSLSRIGMALIIIICVIYGTVFMLKKLSGKRLGGGGRFKTVTVIEQTYIAPKKSVCLLKMADRAVLVGVTDNTISMLTECNWDDLPEENRIQSRKSEVGFSQLLSSATGKLFGAKSTQGGSHENSA